jgi:hypothetical protein
VSVSSFVAPLQYLVYLVLIVIILFRLINHNIRIKTSVCIPHISLASLAMVANGIIFWFVCVCISSCLLFLWRLKKITWRSCNLCVYSLNLSQSRTSKSLWHDMSRCLHPDTSTFFFQGAIF